MARSEDRPPVAVRLPQIVQVAAWMTTVTIVAGWLLAAYCYISIRRDISQAAESFKVPDKFSPFPKGGGP